MAHLSFKLGTCGQYDNYATTVWLLMRTSKRRRLAKEWEMPESKRAGVPAMDVNPDSSESSVFGFIKRHLRIILGFAVSWRGG
jgi:hypothetical protein